MINCDRPQPISDYAYPLDKLVFASKMQAYVVCRLQSARKVMEDLAVELSKHSSDAAHKARDMVYGFKPMVQIYLEESRPLIKELSDKITPKMVSPETSSTEFDRVFSGAIQKFSRNETSPGLERSSIQEDMMLLYPHKDNNA